MYIIRLKLKNWKKKKFTWLQACFLGDVGVIGCNSLNDSHFQTYVMNNVEIVIDYYLHIASHISHTVTSCTNFIGYSLLSFVHEIVCELVWPSKIIHFVMFDAKFVEGWFKFLRRKIFFFLENLSWRLCVLKYFWNHLHAFHVMKNLLKNDYAEKFIVFKKFNFPKFRSIKSVFC